MLMNSKKPSKRVKIIRRKDDRFSALPDHLLCRILSLVPTKYAARTSALSRRWKDLFTSVAIIDCDNLVRLNKIERDNFIAFIYRVLNLIVLNSSYIDRFCISIARKLPGEAIIFSWISTALRYNVRELSITLNGKSLILLPRPLFTCKSLVDLRLDGKFFVTVPHHVSLPSLKTLSLKVVIIQDDESLKRLISGCPILEDLLCYNLANIEVFDVSSPSLKKFVFRCVDDDCELLLKAPNLKIFDFRGSPVRGCSGDALNSLTEASIRVNLENRGDVSQVKKIAVHEIIKKASNAHKLLLVGDTMEVLGYAPQLLPNFHALTHLDLGASRDKGWKLLPHLLENSPCIGTLILKRFGNEHGQFPLPHVPTCFSMNLKTIHLKWFRAKEEEFTMVKYILKNAKVLESMMIHTGTVGMLPQSEDFQQISASLLYLSIFSKTCTILLDGLRLSGI